MVAKPVYNLVFVFFQRSHCVFLWVTHLHRFSFILRLCCLSAVFHLYSILRSILCLILLPLFLFFVSAFVLLDCALVLHVGHGLVHGGLGFDVRQRDVEQACRVAVVVLVLHFVDCHFHVGIFIIN